MTWAIASRSSPRAATSVATSVVDPARAELLERALALRLRHVAVHGDDVDVAPRELLREPVGPALRADEDEREPRLGLEQLDEAVDLVVGGDRDEVVLDHAVLDVGARAVLEARRRPRCTRTRAHRPRRRASPRRASSAGPSAGAARSARPAAEAHVEHPVGLVEDERPDGVEEISFRSMRSWRRPGRRDDDVCALEALRLRADRRAAVGDADADALRRGEAARSRRRPGARARGSARGRARTASSRRTAPARRATCRRRVSCPTPSAPWPGRRRPASASGRTSDWIRNGSTMPRAASACSTAALTPSAENCCICCSTPCLLAVRDHTTRNRLRRNEKLKSHGTTHCRPWNQRSRRSPARIGMDSRFAGGVSGQAQRSSYEHEGL